MDLENGRDGENGGLVPAPCRPIDVREPAVSRVPGEPSIGTRRRTKQRAQSYETPATKTARARIREE